MRRWTLAAALLALVTVATPAVARFGFPEPRTPRAETIENIYVQITVAAIIVFLIVMAIMAYILVRFREKGGQGRATFEHERDNLKAEMFWTIIPLIIVLWVGVISYQALVDLDNINDEEVHPAAILDITASRYAWSAQYDTGVQVAAIANPDLSAIKPFYVPADVPLLFRVTGADVIHSWNLLGLAQTVDAVPGQINELLVKEGIPEGEYFTQCKENCLTPGHSYMHANVIAVGMAEYQEWTEKSLAGAAAGLEQVVPLLYGEDDVFAPLGQDQLAKGATAFIQVLYNGTAPEMDFTFNGETLTAARGSLIVFEYPVNETGAIDVMAADGKTVALTAVEPVAVNIDLGPFIIEPKNLELEAGKLYALTVTNAHTALHNLYIGMSGGDGVTDAIWSTGDLNGGASQVILVSPGEASTLETWCSVVGHYGLGMHGTLTIV